MPDLSTKYMGLHLRSPLVVSANPLSQKVENIVAMEDAGAGAVVLFSLFEEQIRREAERFEVINRVTTNAFAESSYFFPDLQDFAVGTGQYLDIIRKAKDRVDIPDHRQSQRHHSRRLDRVCPRDRTGRCRCPRGQYLLHSGRYQYDLGGCRKTIS